MPPRARRAIALVASIAVLAPPLALFPVPSARAQGKPPALKNQLTGAAREHFETGVRLAERREWNGARTSFLAAYEASRNPRVLYNVAIAEREMRRYAAAVETFKRYLTEGGGKLTKAEAGEAAAAVASLERLLAALTIEVNEPGADVYVDGEKVGSSPLKGPVMVFVGERNVRATKPGFAEAAESVAVQPGAASKASLRLAPLVKTALVNVTVAGPSNAVVSIDGKEVGPAPYTGRIAVTTEPHLFSAQAPGYVATSQSVFVTERAEGEPLKVRLEPAPEQRMGKLVVVAKPEGSTIEIDGTPVGASRWEGPVSAKPHQVVVKKRGYYPFSYDVDVPRGGERSVTAALNEDRNTNFVPWLIGTVVVLGATTAAVVLIASKPDPDPVNGTLPPFTIGTQGFRF